MSEPSNPKERALDAFVFAPLAMVLQPQSSVEHLAKVGREQLAFSRSLGKAVLRTVRSAAAGDNGVGRSAMANRLASPSAEAGSPAARPATLEPLPVDGYDGLTARDIVALVAHCSIEQVAWIEQHERDGKARVTVLRAASTRLKNAP